MGSKDIFFTHMRPNLVQAGNHQASYDFNIPPGHGHMPKDIEDRAEGKIDVGRVREAGDTQAHPAFARRSTADRFAGIEVGPRDAAGFRRCRSVQRSDKLPPSNPESET